MEDLIQNYLEYRKTLNLSPATLRLDRTGLRRFQSFLAKQKLTITTVTATTIKAYWQSLQSLSTGTIHHYLVTLKQFYQYCCKHNLVLLDPFRNLELPGHLKTIPAQVPTPGQLRELIESIDITTWIGLRDRAIFELVYSSGLRAGETANLNLIDLDLQNRLIRVIGKGNKERIIPFGKTAAYYLKLYIKSRTNKTNPSLFQNRAGGRISRDILEARLRLHAARLDLRLKFHSLRHACALHLLQNHAGIRSIQELLGHRCLESTQIYTQLVPLDLKKAHNRYHPREKEVRRLG